MSLERLWFQVRPRARCILSIWRCPSGNSGRSWCSTSSIRLATSVTVSGTPLTLRLPLRDLLSRSSMLFSSCTICA
ncbi:hypothetical protein XELAEV_18013012mg [Xenopus laevis]|uniref:Uncharacterized protein n=1 Tax=Xenopus laevis TaxID=8355 RepID=A0A974DQ10_XENLA|nr:hypothetical protein XELAEV_18013012mg [Xenopus laevis]